MSSLWRDNWREWPEGEDPPPGPPKKSVKWMLKKKSGWRQTFRFNDWPEGYRTLDQSWEHTGILVGFEVVKLQGIGPSTSTKYYHPQFELNLTFEDGSYFEVFGLEIFHPLRYGMADRMHQKTFEIERPKPSRFGFMDIITRMGT